MRLFFSIMDEGIHFNKSNSLSLAFFPDLALLCLSSLPREPKHYHQILRAKLLPTMQISSLNSDQIINQFDYLIQFQILFTVKLISLCSYLVQKMSFPFPPTFLFLPTVPAFTQLSTKIQDLPLIILLPDLLHIINSINQILLIFQ